MGITLTDNSFELIFQHLQFSDILNLSQVSKSLNEIISNSSKCMKKFNLKLIKNENEEVLEFVRHFRVNKRKYQNVVVDCHNNHYITEKYMLILKTIERSVVDLEVRNASFRWDEINTRNFHDQWLIMTDLKKLKVYSINDYTAEIFFISCTYLEHLHVEDVRLSKYFNYCLRINEKLKELKVLQPLGISYDYEFYGFTAYNFKLDCFEFNCKENGEKNKHEFLKRVIYPILTTQVKCLKKCTVNGVYIGAVNSILDALNCENFDCKKLNYGVSSAHVKFSINDMHFNCIDIHENRSEFHEKLMTFIERQKSNLKEITLGSACEEIQSVLFKKTLKVDYISIADSFPFNLNVKNDQIVKIITSSTCTEEIKSFLRISPRLKILQIFALTKELLEFIHQEMKQIEIIRYHYIDVDCYSCMIKLQKYNNFDPILRICDDIHELLFQHLDDKCFAEELTKTWTRFYFQV